MGHQTSFGSIFRHATLLVALLGSWTETATLRAQVSPQGKPPTVSFDPKTGMMNIGFAESDGMSLKEFIKWAEITTVPKKTFYFSEQELAGAADSKVQFLGTLQIRPENFFSFFQTILYMKQFACVVRDLKDSDMVQIIAMNGPLRGEIANAARLVKPEDIVNYANQPGVQILSSIALEYVNAQNATNQLRPFFATNAAGGAGTLLFGAVNQRAFLLQGYGPQVYAAYQLLKLVDVPPEAPDQQIRVQKLYNAAAEELEPILNDILNDKTRRGAAPAAGVSGADIAGPQVQLKIMAHTTLNSLILSGSKEQLFEAQDLIARLDVPVDQIGGDYSIMRMQNVLSDELQQTLSRFINEDQQAETQAQAPGAAGASGQQRRTRKTVVISHKESNSLIMSGTATKLKQIKSLINNQLDARQPQVLVECAIIELTTDDLMRLGFELAFLDTKANGNYTRPFGYTSFGLSQFQDTDGNGLPDTRLPDFSNPLQGVTGGIISGGDFGIPVLMNALAQDTRANVLSLPSVVVNNNYNATVTTTEDRPTTTSQQGTATTSNSFSGFQNAGITLNISPSISSNSYLRLSIDLQVSRFLTPFDPASSVPGVKTTRQVKTQVIIPSGSTMILGGVIQDQESDAKSGIPFLKDIPILGWLFSNGSTQNTKTNLYFFLTPHILDEDDFQDLADLSLKKKLEAAQFLGDRRIEIIDKKWRGLKVESDRLQDPNASLDDFARKAGTDMPYYDRAKRDLDQRTVDKIKPKGLPAGPTGPTNNTTGSRPSSEHR